MKNQFTILGAALILGLSFVTGCLIMSSVRASSNEAAMESRDTAFPLMTLAETAQFLRLSEDQVLNIIKAENAILRNDGPFKGTKLPYIKVDNKFLFNNLQILNWIQAASLEQRVYSGTKLTNK